MKRVNETAVKNLNGDAISSLKANGNNGGKVVTAIGLTLALSVTTAVPVLANTPQPNNNYPNYYYANPTHGAGLIDYSNYDIVNYNSNWGVQYADHSLNVNVNRNNVGLIKISEAPSDLRRAINEYLGERNVNNSRYQYVTFDVAPNRANDTYWIDLNSFAFYTGNIANLGNMYIRTVILRSKVFVSPDNQTWVDEQNYKDYIKNQRVIFECSDGVLVNSYDSFVAWETELAKRANNENSTIIDDPNQNKQLNEIAHVVAFDGTIWQNQTLMNEYIRWCADKNYNYRDGVYYGVYGNFVSFEDYMRYFNIGYFINNGLKASEQYYGAYGMLYSTSAQARASFERLPGYQKVK